MSYNKGHCVRSMRPILPPLSTRTLHHPSFLPLYMAAGFTRHYTGCSNHTVHPIIPAEFFYTDPTMSCGRRTANIVTELMVFDCFQLNTPPPLMSACPAPPTRPDPFRSASHPTRELGSLTLKINPLHPPGQPHRVVLQLTQEEDEAVTNLLKLHHQEPVHSDGRQREASLGGRLQQGRRWSDTELEAADTLLSGFSLMEGDETWGRNHKESAATPPGPLPPHQHRGSESLPAFVPTDCTQNDVGCISRVWEYGGSGDFAFELSVSGGFSAKERALSASEGDAVHVLLSLGDMR